MRYFYRRETSASGVERVFTVAYIHDRHTGETQYGAAVFRRDSPSETFIKSEHRQTASGRLSKCPVSLTVKTETANELEQAIRDSIRSVGVRGPRPV